MGQAKQLLKINDRTLIQRTVETVLKADFETIAIVLGANKELLIPEIIQYPILIIENENYKEGIGTSIAKGTEEILKLDRELDAVIILLCDQVLLYEELLMEIKQLFLERTQTIIASEYADSLGVPALFGKEFFKDLKNLKGDEGAKKIILKNLDSVGKINFPEGEVDLDTWDQYQAFLKTGIK